MERLQKIIANYGYCSRRKAEELISHGKVFVNGEKVAELGFKAAEDDIIEINGEKLQKTNKKIYILLNKPIGVVTTASDENGRPTVINLIENEIKERLFPVGRLDIATSGALILTNDGDFAYNLTHPSREIPKTYEVTLNKEITKEEKIALECGVKIPLQWRGDTIASQIAPLHEGCASLPPSLREVPRRDGGSGGREHNGVVKTAPCTIKMLSEKHLLITIHEGRNRQIRKMFESIGKKVLELKRIQIGNISLGNLPLGRFRYLSLSEISSLNF